MSSTPADVVIFFTNDGQAASELLRDRLSPEASAGTNSLGGHSSIQVLTNPIEGTLLERSLRPKCVLALFASDVFESHVALLRFHKIFSKLQSASRFFPIAVANHEKILSSLTRTLPLIADRHPFRLTEKNAEDFVRFMKAKLQSASSSIDIKSTFDVVTMDTVWPEEEKVVNVSWKRGKLGIVIQNLRDATGKAAAIFVRTSSAHELQEGDQLLGFAGCPDVKGYADFRRQLKGKDDAPIQLRVRSSSQSRQRLEHFQKQVNELQDLSLLQERQSGREFKVLILCCKEDAPLSESLEQRMPRSVLSQRVVVGQDYPNAGTVNFQLLLFILSPAFFKSRKAEKTLQFLENKMKEYHSQVLVVSVEEMQPLKPFSNLIIGKNLSNFSELSTKIREHAFAARSCLVLDIFDEMIKSKFGLDTITLKKERNYPDENFKFRENEKPETKKRIAHLVSVMKTRPKEARTKELLDLAMRSGFSYAHYKDIHRFSLEHPDLFWGELAEEYYFRVGDSNDLCAPGSLRENVISKTFFDGRTDRRNDSAVTVLPGRKTNLCANMLDRWAGETPKVDKSKHTALIFVPADSSLPPVQKTYEELLWATKKFASFLENTVKLSESNRALVCMDESPARIVVLLACFRIGVTVGTEGANNFVEKTFTNSLSDVKISMSESEKLQIDVNGKIHYFFANKLFDISSKVEHSPKWLSTTHTAFFSTTSGTTSESKVVEHLAGSYIVGAAANMRYLLDFNLIDPGNDVCLVTSDLCWIYGFTVGFCTPLLNGGTIVRVANMAEALKSKRIWSIVAECGITHFCSVPKIIGNLVEEIADAETLKRMDRLQVIASAGDRLYDKDIKRVMKFLRENHHHKIKLYDVYGQTETACCLTLSSCCDVEEFNNHPKKMVPFYGVSAKIKVKPNRNAGGAPHRVLVYDKPFPGCFSRYVGHDDVYERAFSEDAYDTGDNVEYQLEHTHDPEDSPRTFIIVGRKESVLNFMTPMRTYSVAAEDVEELCCHKDIWRTRAFTFKIEGRNILGLQIETKRKMNFSAQEHLQKELREKIHELRNLVHYDRDLDIKFIFNRIEETRGKTVRKNDPSPPLQPAIA